MRTTALILVLGLVSCGPKPHSNLGVDSWGGYTIDGQQVKLNDLNSPAVILNFYSPICQPCIEELPSLEKLYQDAKQKQVAMYLALEPDLEKNGIDNVETNDLNKIRSLLVERVMQDVKRYGIEIPILIMNKPFSIEANGIVTGTPETLFFRTNPLRLHYNFIGPISIATTQTDLEKSSRYHFAVSKLNETLITDSYRPREGY
ncbi:MAG: TlpA family protein disulfide reductase [Leptonema sp. (in: Bacteria)]|nr:TlpA family protein disulfide reductase [Leptonema sp. (in: bacteria)]